MKKRITERFIPEDSTGFINEEAQTAVYCYGTEGVPLAIGYSAKRKKPDFHLRFKSVERRNEYIKEFEETKLNTINENIKYKADKKAREEEEFKNIKVGDIFHCGWGYNQTQCDFYKLTELKGKTGTFISIGNIETDKETGFDSCYEKADPTKEFGDTFKKRLKGSSFNLSSFQHVSKVEDINKSFYHSWYN